MTVELDAARAHLAGIVASDLAIDLAAPLRTVGDRLAIAVDVIDRHVATSTGPTPYPWKATVALRQELASSYLDATAAARRIDDLKGVLLTLDKPAAIEPVNEAVEVGVHLAGHRVVDHVELIVDLRPIPHGHLERGGLALIVARAVMLCADSAAPVPGAALSVRTRLDPDDDRIAISISDNGRGASGVLEAAGLMATIVEDWGGSIDAAVDDNAGCAFEIRVKRG